jgi:hypothetical protein
VTTHLNFSVVLKQTAPPTADQLKRAFRSFSNLTDADATRLASTAHGILMKRLNNDAARALQLALQSEGVATNVVSEAEFPVLSPAKFIRRLELSPTALTIFDPLGREMPVEWRHISMIAAGAVRHFEVNKTRSERTEIGFSPMRGLHARVVEDVHRRVQADRRLVLEILLFGGSMRFETEAAQFLFKPLLDDPKMPIEAKFGWLVRQLCERAPHAAVNRGAFALREGDTELPEYASRQSLTDEILWLLWRVGQRDR